VFQNDSVKFERRGDGTEITKEGDCPASKICQLLIGDIFFERRGVSVDSLKNE
jgi:hypothetical protein